jgi:hypothetical protein
MPSLFPVHPKRLQIRHFGWRGLCRPCGQPAAVALAWLLACAAQAQEPLSLEPDQRWLPSNLQQDCARRTAACVAVDGVSEASAHPGTDAEQLRRRNLALIAGSTLSVGLYGWRKWWSDGFSSHFKSRNEHWFGRQTYAGGADKLGHFFMNYAGTRLMTKAFNWAGNDPAASVDMAAWLTLGIFTGVEVLDGYAKKWHFSKEDALINAAGVAAGVLFEAKPGLDKLIDLRILYQPSRENGRRFEPFGDYSGQTYLMVAKASGVDVLRHHPVLRYIELAVGYRARGYSDVGGRLVEIGTRSLYAGISLNLSEVLGQTVFRQSHGSAQAVADTVLEYVQVPGTAVLGRFGLDD